MKYGIVKDIILYAVILLVQILILNHIHLFGVATPLLYVYLIMLLKRNCGANVDARPSHLVQFAKMGYIHMQGL